MRGRYTGALVGVRKDGQPHRSPRAGSLWLEKRGDALYWKGRQTEKGKATVRVSVAVPRGLTGRELERATEKARRDCDTLLKIRIAERDRDALLPVNRERATLAEYAELWLAAAEHSERRASTVAVHRSRLENHVLDHLGGAKLRDLRKEHVVKWWDKMTSPAVRFHAHTTLMAVLHQAADDEYPVAASLLRMERPAYAVPDQPHASPAQVRLLLEHSPEPWRTLFLLAYATTARISELVGFKWGDLDEVNRALALTHQRDRETGERVELKARRQRRRIALGPDTLAALKAHRQRETTAGRGKADDWLFHRGDGRPAAYWMAQRAYKDALKAADLPLTLKLHSLRHGGAQALLDAGVDLDTVSRRLGHADVGTTSETYLRASPTADAEAARRIERAMRGKGK